MALFASRPFPLLFDPTTHIYMSDLASLQSVLASLPPTVNPYDAVYLSLRHKLIPPPENIFLINCYIFWGLGALTVLFGVLAICCRLYIGSAWLFRKKHNGIITPNTTLLLAINLTVFGVLLIILVHYLLDANRDDQSPIPEHGMQGIVWLPIVLSGWTEAYGQCVSAYLSRHNRERKHRFSAFSQLKEKVNTNIVIPAWAINVFFLSGYLAQALIVLPLFGYGTVQLKKAWAALHAIEVAIKPFSDAWVTGQAFVLNPAHLPLLQRFNETGSVALRWIGNGFLAYSVILIFVTFVCFIPSSCIYIRMLSAQINEYLRNLHHVEDTQSYVRIHSLRGTYRLMITETLLVFLFSCVLTGASTWIAVTPELLEDAHKLAIIYGLVLWVCMSIVLPLNFLLFYRAFRPIWIARRAQRRGVSNLVSAIAVETIMERLVEGDNSEDEVKPVILQPIPNDNRIARPQLVHFHSKESLEKHAI